VLCVVCYEGRVICEKCGDEKRVDPFRSCPFVHPTPSLTTALVAPMPRTISSAVTNTHDTRSGSNSTDSSDSSKSKKKKKRKSSSGDDVVVERVNGCNFITSSSMDLLPQLTSDACATLPPPSTAHSHSHAHRLLAMDPPLPENSTASIRVVTPANPSAASNKHSTQTEQHDIKASSSPRPVKNKKMKAGNSKNASTATATATATATVTATATATVSKKGRKPKAKESRSQKKAKVGVNFITVRN
jgi:hypothetical protein